MLKTSHKTFSFFYFQLQTEFMWKLIKTTSGASIYSVGMESWRVCVVPLAAVL